MRKILSLFTLMCFLCISAQAQTVVNHAIGTSQNYGGINVGISEVVPSSPSQVFPGGICGAGPYWIGNNVRNGLRFTFSQPVTKVRVRMSRLHRANPTAGEEIAFRVDGAAYTLQPNDLSAFPGTCGLPFTASITTGGYLTDLVTPLIGNPDGSGVEVNITNPTFPHTINSFDIEHLNNVPNLRGVLFELAFTDDTCDLPFDLTATDSTPCTNRCIKLQATRFPNAVYTWGDDGTPIPGITSVDSFERQMCNLSLLQTGKYWVTAQRGTCVFTDSIYIKTELTPFAPTQMYSKYPNGICRGAEDSLYGVSQGASGIEYRWFRKSGAQISGGNGNPTTGPTGSLVIPSFDVSDNDIYCLYVNTTNTNPNLVCISDTSCLVRQMLPDVTADFEVITQLAGCVNDTVHVRNKSIGADQGYLWRFFDTYTPVGTVTSTDASQIVTHLFPVPKPNVPQPVPNVDGRTYTIELVAINSGCRDSITKTAFYNHPLVVDFAIDKDEICQGDLLDSVHFVDNTSDPVGGPHSYTWVFGPPNRDSSFKSNDTAFLYTRSSILEPNGVWRARLIVKDYLGCIDSMVKEIFVDSTGPITFTQSDTIVCAGKQIRFEGDLNRVGLEGYFWNFGNGNVIADTNVAVFNYDIPGLYEVSFNAQYRVCRDTYTVQRILVKQLPRIDLGPDSTMCPNSGPIHIFDRIARDPSEGLKWKWSTPNPRDTGSGVWVRQPGIYSATVKVNGCEAADTVNIVRDCYLDIPNVFTPDGDGRNDYFLPRQLLSRSVASFKMTVFNRWGQKVFETTNINGRGWDGNFNSERQPQGVYPYLLEVSFSNKAGDMERYEGNVTLLR